jgi:exo-beta-1,3-glucanase (GH17 family)
MRNLNMVPAKKRCCNIFLILTFIFFIVSCTKDGDPIIPDPSTDIDSLNFQDDVDSFVLHRTDSAFFNDDKILNAVCYGPFRNGQGPGSTLSKSQIKEDLLIMEKHWDAFRLYITDRNAEHILNGIAENGIDIKVMLGVWISGNAPKDNATQVENAIALANTYPDIVQAISCGNEIFGLSGSDIFVSDKSEIIGYLNDMRARTQVPVTIDDIYFVWTDEYYSDVVAALDFITIHLYGQWSNIPLENTVDYIDEVMHDLWKKFPEKEIVIGETGWTTSKNPGQFGPVADEASQKQFYEACQAWSKLNKVTVFYFEAFNERWKGDTSTEAETNWGFYYADRTPKLVFQAGD